MNPFCSLLINSYSIGLILFVIQVEIDSFSLLSSDIGLHFLKIKFLSLPYFGRHVIMPAKKLLGNLPTEHFLDVVISYWVKVLVRKEYDI